MSRCYVCNAEPSDPCKAVDGEMAECPRSVRQVVEAYKREAKKCPSGRPEHEMEPEWRGRSYAYMKCRWCNKREAV